MTVGFSGRIGNSDRGNDYRNNDYREAGNRYGISMNDYYKIDENGNRIFDIEAYLNAIDEAKTENSESSESAAGQNDSFERTSDINGSSKKDTQDAKTAQETIDEEYNAAIEGYYNAFENADLSEEAKNEAEEAWATVNEMEATLTQVDITSATVIAGVSEFVSKIDEAVSATNAAMNADDDNEEPTLTLQTETEGDDTENNFFANNPFMTSAFDTSIVEEEEFAA